MSAQCRTDERDKTRLKSAEVRLSAGMVGHSKTIHMDEMSANRGCAVTLNSRETALWEVSC
jgi:hypothetical protein